MARFRMLVGWTSRSLGIALLAVILASSAPMITKAIPYTPVVRIVPHDPGTPFEEPEGGSGTGIAVPPTESKGVNGTGPSAAAAGPKTTIATSPSDPVVIDSRNFLNSIYISRILVLWRLWN